MPSCHRSNTHPLQFQLNICPRENFNTNDRKTHAEQESPMPYCAPPSTPTTSMSKRGIRNASEGTKNGNTHTDTHTHTNTNHFRAMRQPLRCFKGIPHRTRNRSVNKVCIIRTCGTGNRQEDHTATTPDYNTSPRQSRGLVVIKNERCAQTCGTVVRLWVVSVLRLINTRHVT